MSLDPRRPAVTQARALAARFPDFPLLGGAEIARLSAIVAGGRAVDFGRDIRPWLGREASIALMDTPTSAAGSLIVLDVSASARAHAFLLGEGAGGVLGAIGTLLDQPALAAATVSLSPAPGGARIRVHSALDPVLARLHGRAQPFTPTLRNLMPAGSTALLDVNELERAAPRVLAAGAVGGVGAGVAALLRRLGCALGSEGVDVGSVLSIFSGETAIGIGPATAGAAGSLVLISRTRDDAAAQSALAALELPLERLFPTPSSGPGQEPVLGDQAVEGVTVHQLALAPGFQIDFAVFHGLVVVSTGIGGIAAVVHHEHTLADSAAFRTTLGNRPAGVTSLVFVDLSQLLRFGEQTGLMRGERYQAVRPDLQKIREVGGVDSASGAGDSTADLFLEIS